MYQSFLLYFVVIRFKKRARDIGFDWDSVEGALDKVKEEYYEVIEAMNNFEGGDVGRIEEELGGICYFQ